MSTACFPQRNIKIPNEKKKKKPGSKTMRTSDIELTGLHRAAELGSQRANLSSLWGCQELAARQTG